MNTIRVNVAWTLLGQIAEKGVPFISSIVLVRVLDPKDYSNFAFLNISALSIAALATIGIPVATTKLERSIADGVKEDVHTFAILQRYAFFQALVVVLCAIASTPLWLPNWGWLNVFVLALASTGLSLSAVPLAKLVAHRKFRESALASLSGGTMLSIGTLVAYLQKSPIPALWGLATSALVIPTVAKLFTPKEETTNRHDDKEKQHRNASIVFSKIAPLAASSAIAALTNLGLAKIVASAPNGNADTFSAYAIGMQWYALAQFLPSILNRVSFPDILIHENQEITHPNSTPSSHTKNIRISTLTAAATASFIGILATPLAWLYNTSHITPSLITLFAVASIITAPINVYGNVIIAKSKEIAWLGCMLLWSCAALVTAYFLRNWGPYGAISALALGGSAQFIVARLLARQQSKEPAQINSRKLFFVRLLFPLIPETRFFSLKRCLLRWCGAKVGCNVRITSSAKFLLSGKLQIGDDVWIGEQVLITGGNAEVRIGSHVDIGPRVILVTGSHKLWDSEDRAAGEGYSKPIAIEDGVWLGAGSIILGGVSVGRASVIAAGAVVTRNTEPQTINAGNPAVLKRRRASHNNANSYPD